MKIKMILNTFDLIDQINLSDDDIYVQDLIVEMDTYFKRNPRKVNAKDHKNRTPLIYATKKLNGEKLKMVIKILLDHGADINYIDRSEYTALLYALEYSNCNNAMFKIKLLLDHGAQVNFLNNKGICPLFIAIFKSNYDAVKMLLDYKADVNVKGAFGTTPLLCAPRFKKNSDKIIKILLEHGANIHDVDDGGSSSFDIALRCNPNVIDFLLPTREKFIKYVCAHKNTYDAHNYWEVKKYDYKILSVYKIVNFCHILKFL